MFRLLIILYGDNWMMHFNVVRDYPLSLKLQKVPLVATILYMNKVIFEHDKIQILK